MASAVQQNNSDSTASSSTPVWMKRVPMITGVLAGLAGFLTVRSANMANQANYNSTQAVLHQAQSSDAWNEYEADSLKRHIDENSLRIGIADPAVKQSVEAEISDLKTRQDLKKPEAEFEAKLRDQEVENSEHKLLVKNFLDYAGVAAQLGIALASIAALTRKQIAYHFGLAAGAIAIAVTGYALVWPYVAHLIGH